MHNKYVGVQLFCCHILWVVSNISTYLYQVSQKSMTNFRIKNAIQTERSHWIISYRTHNHVVIILNYFVHIDAAICLSERNFLDGVCKLSPRIMNRSRYSGLQKHNFKWPVCMHLFMHVCLPCVCVHYIALLWTSTLSRMYPNPCQLTAVNKHKHIPWVKATFYDPIIEKLR